MQMMHVKQNKKLYKIRPLGTMSDLSMIKHLHLFHSDQGTR